MSGEYTDSRGTVAELRALLDGATPGPWECDCDKFDAENDIQACVTDPSIDMLAMIATGVNFPQPEDPVPYTPAMREEAKAAWAKAYDSQAYRDAQLIAALRNAAPDLLRVVEAAQDLLVVTGCHDGCSCRMCRLRSAVATLTAGSDQ